MSNDRKLRLRMKVWTHPRTNRRYLMPTAFLISRNGDMKAFAMRDDETLEVSLSVAEWNSLPFRYFVEDGEAERAVRKYMPITFADDEVH